MTEFNREEQAREFWAAVKQTRAIVESWPKWKRDAAEFARVSPRIEAPSKSDSSSR
ncbi:hypothetical protein ACNOYE_12525 [Nannocystaceae bacterium ST9]